MNTFDGYIRRNGTNSKVLLDGGNAKALSEFIGTISYANNKITYTKADGTSYDLINLSNYIYNLGAATSDNLGGIKIGFSQSGKNYPVQLDANNKAYVYVPWEENSHYTTRLYVGDGTAENKITTNGNTKITVTDNNNVRNYITLIGSGATNISSDDNGKITINSINTIYNTGDLATLNKGTNTEGKLWSAKTLVDYISDILGVDSTAITSLNTLIGLLHDNDTATGILVELAKKLNTPSSSIGNNNQPIYWNGSSFTTIGYTIEKSVPSNAIFTDTKYSFYVGENNNIKEHKNVSNPYFKLFENNTPTSIQIKAGTGISVSSDINGNITIKNESPDLNHNTDKTGIKLGTTSGTKKTDSTVIINDSSTGLTIAGGINKFSIGDGTNYIEIPITPSFTVTNKDATIGTSLTTIATIAGTDIKAKIGNYLPLSGGTVTGDIVLHDDVAVIWSPNFINYTRMPFRIEDGNYFTGINLYNSYGNIFTKLGIFTDKYGKGNNTNSIFLYPDSAPKIGTNTIYHSGNLSVSKSGETLTVNIGGTSYSLTNTNTWRGITDSYSGTDSTISLSLKGGNDLYNSLLNGYASSAGNADTVDNIHATGFLLWKCKENVGVDSTFLSSVDYFNNLSNLNNGGTLVYNHRGSEYTILFTRRNDIGHGSILKWGYPDNYIRIIRMYSGIAKSTDWEKISAGYADSAGSVAWKNVSEKPTSYPVLVNQNIINNNDYPLIWTGNRSTENAVVFQLEKSAGNLLYNPYSNRLKRVGLEGTLYGQLLRQADVETVSAARYVYVKLGTFDYNSFGTLCVHLEGNAIKDELYINYGSGNAIAPLVCGWYASHAGNVKEIDLVYGTSWNGDCELWLNVYQSSTLNIAVLRAIRGDGFTVNIATDWSATTTSPTFNKRVPLIRGMFGDLSGNASSASKLTTNAGSATQPVYFSGGVPTTCSYQLNKTVPSDAVFTDINATQCLITKNANYPLLFSTTEITNTSTYFTNTVARNNSIYANPSTGTITANKFNGGILELYPGNVTDYAQGIRIHSTSDEWTALTFCGTDNTGTSGTSANSWSLHTYKGNFYINRNNCNTATVNRLWGHSNGYTIGNTTESGYNFTVGGTSRFIGTTTTSHIIPASNNIYNIGSTTVEYANTFSRAVFARHLNASSPYSNDKNLYLGYNSTTNILFYITDINGNNRKRVALFKQDGNAIFDNTVTASSFYASSDSRLKNIISDIQYSSEEIASLCSVKYTWKNKNEKVHIGSIALDVERIIPEVVNIDNEGYKSLDYATLGAIGVISLAREIVELKKEIKELKSKLYG